eukprot:1013423-Rhodomonas_salina.3
MTWSRTRGAGHGAQFHAMAEALSYALASNRTLVLNDSCTWSLKEGGSDAGAFWPRYFQDITDCDAAQSVEGAEVRRPVR